MKRILQTFILLLLLTGFAVSAPAETLSAHIAGKVADADKIGVAGVRVMAWPTAGVSLEEEAPFVSTPSGRDGHYRLPLPAGEYFILAEGNGWFCYYGRNPVTIPEQGLTDVNLSLVKPQNVDVPVQADFASGVVGQVLHQGEPMPGAIIFAYLDPSSDFKGMGYGMTAPTGAEGYFVGPLPPGTYYLLVRRRQQPAAIGPLQAGDFIGYWHGNPLKIGEGEVKKVSISLLEVPDKVAGLQTSLFGDTSIEGRIVDKEGNPVAGMRALLYEDSQMLNRPLYVSQPTGPDGRFALSFPEGGKYYVGARSSIGGAPAPGDLVGAYAGTPDYTVEIEEGEHIKGIEIRVGEMW